MSFDQIMKEELFSIPDFGTINCHSGKLPMYRGRNILNWVLINGEDEFGITVHYIDKGIDTGDIICQETFEIYLSDNYKSILEKTYINCPLVLIKAINLIYDGNVKRIPQKSISLEGLYCSRRISGDEMINWNQSSSDIFNFIRALVDPGPFATANLNGNELKIIEAELVPDAPSYKGIPGSILCKDNAGFLVKTKDSYIRITLWNCSIDPLTGMRFK